MVALKFVQKYICINCLSHWTLKTPDESNFKKKGLILAPCSGRCNPSWQGGQKGRSLRWVTCVRNQISEREEGWCPAHCLCSFRVEPSLWNNTTILGGSSHLSYYSLGNPSQTRWETCLYGYKGFKVQSRLTVPTSKMPNSVSEIPRSVAKVPLNFSHEKIALT